MMMNPKRYPKTILASLCIPWRDDWTFDAAQFGRQVDFLLNEGVDHIYLFGTAGEGYAVCTAMFEEIIATFSRCASGTGIEPMTGIISLSMQEIIRRIEIACSYGIRDIQLSLPSWHVPTDEEIDGFFQEVCGRYPECRFLIYNTKRSGRVLKLTELERLALMIPNLAAVKYPAADLSVVHALAVSASPLQFFCTEEAFGFGSLFGELGLLLSIGWISMKQTRSFFLASTEHNEQEIIRYVNEAAGVRALLKAEAGQGRIDGYYDSLYTKIALPEFPLRLQPPYHGANESTFRSVLQSIQEHFPKWAGD
jgi:dihydrodipicolinate synthase/N-acetylneuraminate lyase